MSFSSFFRKSLLNVPDNPKFCVSKVKRPVSIKCPVFKKSCLNTSKNVIFVAKLILPERKFKF